MIIPIFTINGVCAFDFDNVTVTKDISLGDYRIQIFDKIEDGYLRQYLSLFKKEENEWVRKETHLYSNIMDFNCFLISKEKNNIYNTQSSDYRHYFKEHVEQDTIIYLLGDFGDKYFLNKDTIHKGLVDNIKDSMKQVESYDAYQIMRLLGREHIYLEQKEVLLRQLEHLANNFKVTVKGKRAPGDS